MNSLQTLHDVAQEALQEIELTSYDYVVEFTRYKRLLNFILQEIKQMARKPIPTFQNAQAARDRQEKAIERARELLKQQGVEYPVFDAKLSVEENYGRLLAYSEQETALVVQLMREPPNPRPLVFDNVKPVEYMAYNDK